MGIATLACAEINEAIDEAKRAAEGHLASALGLEMRVLQEPMACGCQLTWRGTLQSGAMAMWCRGHTTIYEIAQGVSLLLPLQGQVRSQTNLFDATRRHNGSDAGRPGELLPMDERVD